MATDPKTTVSILIAATHPPPGDPMPHAEDIAMTEQAIEVGELLDIDGLDHIVLAQGGFESMKTRKLAFR